MMSPRLRRCHTALLVLAVLAGSRAVRAQDASWIGTKVCERGPGLTLRIGKDVVATFDHVHRVFTVRRVQGKWLWLEAPDGQQGWARAAEVRSSWEILSQLKGTGDPGGDAVCWAFACLDLDALPMAEEYANEAIKADPTCAIAYVIRGHVHLMDRQDDLALADFDQAIRLDPDGYQGQAYRGRLLTNRGEYDRALPDLDAAVARHPQPAEPLADRARLHHARKELAQAQADADAALQIRPNYPYALAIRARILANRDEVDPAFADCDRAIEIAPRWAVGYATRGTLHAGCGELDPALKDLALARKLDPSSSEAALWSGYCRNWKGEPAQAVRDFRDAARLNPNDLRPLDELAWLLATCPDSSVRDGREAFAFATKACELTHNQSPHPLESRAAAHAALDEFDAAVADQQLALSLLPSGSPETNGMTERLAAYRGHTAYVMPPDAARFPIARSLTRVTR